MASSSHPPPKMSKRILQTDDPIMVQNTRLMGSLKDVLSLGQGAVSWGPCREAVEAAAANMHDPEYFSYGTDHGVPSLRKALVEKISATNGLKGYNVSVTTGANQALAALMITLLDAEDRACIFRPFYFNALMAIQMMGSGVGEKNENVVFGPSDPKNFNPDLDWLEEQLQQPDRPKLVYIVNPCNPTGVTMSKEALQRLADLTAVAGSWLVVDNTYEKFLFSGKEHFAINAPNIIHVFSFSKSYGLMGWRVGYIAYPDHDGSDSFGLQLIKAQDTIPIHACIMSQKIAENSLKMGEQYTLDKIESLRPNREMLLNALSPLGTLGDGIWGGDAIYLFARLPEGCQDDVQIVKWLACERKVAVIPGSGCGYPGYIRVAFGRPKEFKEAATRLKDALIELVKEGPSIAEGV